MGADPAGSQVNEAATAGVIARPPLLFLTALLLGFASDRLLPIPLTVPAGDPVHFTVAGSLVLIGLALAAAGIRSFSTGGDACAYERAHPLLATAGVHGWSRKPNIHIAAPADRRLADLRQSRYARS